MTYMVKVSKDVDTLLQRLAQSRARDLTTFHYESKVREVIEDAIRYLAKKELGYEE